MTEHHGLLCVGDNVVDCYPDLGVMYPGGNAVNVAVHAQRNGAPTSYLGVLGTDEAGALVRSSLTSEGVSTELLRDVDGQNAFAVVRVVEGNRVFECGEIGVSRIRFTDSDLEAVAAAALLHTGECSMVEDDLPRLAAAARFVSFDFSERPWDYVEEHARHVDLAIASAPDAGADPVELCRRIAALGPRFVVVTQGAGGATMLAGGRTLHAPAGEGPVVDTLGAGDAFIGRLLAGLLRDEDLATLLPAATAYATSTCASYGAFGYRTDLPVGLISSAQPATT